MVPAASRAERPPLRAACRSNGAGRNVRRGRPAIARAPHASRAPMPSEPRRAGPPCAGNPRAVHPGHVDVARAIHESLVDDAADLVDAGEQQSPRICRRQPRGVPDAGEVRSKATPPRGSGMGVRRSSPQRTSPSCLLPEPPSSSRPSRRRWAGEQTGFELRLAPAHGLYAIESREIADGRSVPSDSRNSTITRSTSSGNRLLEQNTISFVRASCCGW